MKLFEVLIALCMVAYAVGDRVDVPSDAKKPLELTPKTGDGRVVSSFELFACDHCKMLLTCKFKSYSCRLAKLIVDTGEKVTEYCPENFPGVYVNSYKNKMIVTIENEGNSAGASCQVKSTKPYIDIPEKQIDSNEHGLERKTHKQSTCRCGWANKNPARIVGGNEAEINEFPFPALIMYEDTRHPFCGGSIITQNHILTAAHCTDPIKDRTLLVKVGEHDITSDKETEFTKEHKVAKIYQHDGYKRNNHLNDIAILELATPIEFNDNVGPVCIPTAQQKHVGTYVKVMGWGLTKDKSEKGEASQVLRKVNLRVIDPDVCRDIHNINIFKPTQLCTYNNMKDTCQGDSGGPLVRHNPATNMYEQVALVSYGKKCGSTDPAVNTDVAVYLPWIKEKIGDKGTMCFETSG